MKQESLFIKCIYFQENKLFLRMFYLLLYDEANNSIFLLQSAQNSFNNDLQEISFENH